MRPDNTGNYDKVVESTMCKLGIQDFAQNNQHHFGTFQEHIKAVMNTGYDRFIGHPVRSAEIFEQIADQCFQMPEDQKEYTAESIRQHELKLSKPGKAKAFLEAHPNGFAENLLMLQTADALGQNHEGRLEKLSAIDNFARLMQEN